MLPWNSGKYHDSLVGGLLALVWWALAVPQLNSKFAVQIIIIYIFEIIFSDVEDVSPATPVPSAQ